MDRTSEDAAQHNPEVAGRPEHRSHDSSEDRAGSGDIQKLDHEYLPQRHRHIVNAILFGVGRSDFGRIRSEDLFYKTSVENIAQNQGCYADKQCKHRVVRKNSS